MSKNFEIVYESEIDGTPDQVFYAATQGGSGWLWPMPGELEPRVGGSGPMGSTVTAWEPPRHYANHMEGPNGFFNDLEFEISERPDGKSWLRYVHSGIFFDDWDNQYDGATQHTAFYQHTLGQYVKYFAGRQAAWADVQGPAASSAPDAFDAVKKALGATEVGQTVTVSVPGVGAVTGVIDYLETNFVGLRTETAMFRFFGRNAFGAVVGLAIHDFAEGADIEAEAAGWTQWLDGLYA